MLFRFPCLPSYLIIVYHHPSIRRTLLRQIIDYLHHDPSRTPSHRQTPPSTEMQSLNTQFTWLHSASSTLNTVALITTGMIGWKIGQGALMGMPGSVAASGLGNARA